MTPWNDYGISKFFAWLFVVVPPPALFLAGAVDFAAIFSIIGAVGLGAFGIFIILMARKMRAVIKAGNPRGLLRPNISGLMKWRPSAGILAAAAYELWRMF